MTPPAVPNWGCDTPPITPLTLERTLLSTSFASTKLSKTLWVGQPPFAYLAWNADEATYLDAIPPYPREPPRKVGLISLMASWGTPQPRSDDGCDTPGCPKPGVVTPPITPLTLLWTLLMTAPASTKLSKTSQAGHPPFACLAWNADEATHHDVIHLTLGNPPKK